jgi:NDP-sugar pyrophosphorylase family protein
MDHLRRPSTGVGGSVSESLPPVVIQAGGKGERMRAGGDPTPKVLIRVQGMPLLERLLRHISAEGARQIYIITGHASEQVEAHVAGVRDLTDGTELRVIREAAPRGNVGALSELAGIDSPILFTFGDLITNLSFRTLYRIHRERRAAITAASHFERHRLQLGHLITEGDRVIDYREKPEYEFLICSGIMAVEPQVLSLLPKEGAVGMNRLVMLAVESGLPVTHWTHNADWIDVNTPELLSSANKTNWGVYRHAGQ